ncbi:uncharacterized protein SOCE26_004030 [Sorangium cellulosum]|uniref:MalT-like TPR region domain-containing protein n=2 Tax=Sorangium cellulosum TaxID=56 RepID=A0A2L0EI97_SORCE|nr:uncharacterized protein SOCE26_004030 [Sorangium cellulosum]
MPWVRGVLVKLRALLCRDAPAETAALSELLLQVEPTAEAANLVVFALGATSIVADVAGRLDFAARITARTAALAARFGEQQPDVPAWAIAAEAHRVGYVAEDPWAGLTQAAVAEEICRRTGNRRLQLLLSAVRGTSLWYLGALDEAERELGALAAVHPELGLLSAYPMFCRSGVLADRGALDEARAEAERLVASARARGVGLDEGRGRWALGAALLRAGRLEEAEREVLAARELLAAVALDAPGLLATLAAARLAAGRVDEALAAASEGLDRYLAQGAAGFFRGAQVRLVHAECLHGAGRIDEARGAVASARERLLAIAARIEDPAYRRMFLEDVPENARTLELARAWQGGGGDR